MKKNASYPHGVKSITYSAFLNEDSFKYYFVTQLAITTTTYILSY